LIADPFRRFIHYIPGALRMPSIDKHDSKKPRCKAKYRCEQQFLFRQECRSMWCRLQYDKHIQRTLMICYNNEILSFESVKNLHSLNFGTYSEQSNQGSVHNTGTTMKVLYIKWMKRSHKAATHCEEHHQTIEAKILCAEPETFRLPVQGNASDQKA